MRDEGKIESVGCSNYSLNQMKAVLSVSNIKYIQLPINILNGVSDKNLVDLCVKNEIEIVAYNVLANGLLSGKYHKDSKFPKNDRRSRLPLFRGRMYEEALESVKELKLTASSCNNSISQYSINWALSQPKVVSAIVGIKTPKQMLDNWSAIN
jgi:aryl-alcohol dehydrogenase-like predicted oxidoreductase